MKIKDPNDKFWKWAHHATYLVGALISLHLFANTDHENLKILAGIIASVAASGAVKSIITRNKDKAP